MGFVTKKGGGDEDDGIGRSLELDLDVKACSICRRELLPWQTSCPDDGGAAVPRTELPPEPDPLAERLARFEDEDPDGS